MQIEYMALDMERNMDQQVQMPHLLLYMIAVTFYLLHPSKQRTGHSIVLQCYPMALSHPFVFSQHSYSRCLHLSSLGLSIWDFPSWWAKELQQYMGCWIPNFHFNYKPGKRKLLRCCGTGTKTGFKCYWNVLPLNLWMLWNINASTMTN